MLAGAAQLQQWREAGRRVIHEADTKRLLSDAGIRIPSAAPPGSRCVVKLASDRFPHKSDHGLVRLNVPPEQAAAVAATMRQVDPGGQIVIEEMVVNGVCEWIVGCRWDATFGAVSVVGAGGILVELLDAARVRLAPTTHQAARSAILRQPSAKLLAGIRGGPEGDLDALVEVMVRISRFYADNAQMIEEIEINPLIVLPRGQGAVAADALMILRS